MRDKDITFDFASGASITVGANVITLFTVPTGLTAIRRYTLINPTLIGGSVAAQTAFKVSDTNSRGKLYVYRPKISGFNRILHITAGDAGYLEPVEAWFYDGVILPPSTAANELLKSSSPAGTYSFGISIRMYNCYCNDINNPTRGWTMNFDGDLIVDRGGNFAIKGANVLNGFDCGGTGTYLVGMGAGGDSLEVVGASYWGVGQTLGLALANCVYKISYTGSSGDSILIAASFSQIIYNGDRINLRGVEVSSTPPAVYVDVLVGADNCSVEGHFLDATTAAVRSASLGLQVKGSFESTGAHKTFLEIAGADKSIVYGSVGVSTGGGFTLVGAASRCDVLVVNIP
jgi:hypothetical protein